MRLDKFLAEAAVGTRKLVRNYVKEGKVTVNNIVVLDPAAEIIENTDDIMYLDNHVTHPGKLYYMFHKPAGCVSARKDENYKTVLDYFEANNRNGLFPVGRLDKDTEGLLLITNDGEFNHRLMHPNNHVNKTYYFWAFGKLDSQGKERLKSGVNIGEAEELARAIDIQIENEGIYSDLERVDISNIERIKINPYHQPFISGYITITEGRKHQVKRMLKSVGCYVAYLKRISIGNLKLDESLLKGEYRELTTDEIASLMEIK